MWSEGLTRLCEHVLLVAFVGPFCPAYSPPVALPRGGDQLQPISDRPERLLDGRAIRWGAVLSGARCLKFAGSYQNGGRRCLLATLSARFAV